ncbi:hypothetical protein H0H93_011753 [Arthromyces matolae]|nr:hypothetical protein H0H93_011753 [Arthromyces matolae]
MFLIATALLGIDIANYVTVIANSFIHNPNLGIDTRYADASLVTFKRVVVIDALYGYLTVLGDAIVVWRVYAFWGQNKRRWAFFFLCAVFMGSVITNILLTYCVAVLGTDIFDGAFQRPAFCRNIQTTSYAMPAATTFIATALIGYTTWDYRRTIRPELSKVSRRTRAEKVMYLLVESGFLYFLFFLAQVIGNIPSVSAGISASKNLDFADLIWTFSTILCKFQACYPTLIIILAHSERTMLDGAVSTTLPSFHITSNGSSGSSGTTFTRNTGNLRTSGKNTKQGEEREGMPLHETEEGEFVMHKFERV